MPFSSAARVRLFKFLGYGATSQDASTIDQAIATVEANYDFLIPTIEADLAAMDALDVTLTAEQGSSNSTLIQADVLRWSDTKDKNAGIKAEIDRLRSRVMKLMKLDTETVQVSSGWSSNSLDRG